MLGALLRIPLARINLHVNQVLADAGFGDIRPAHQTVFQHLPQEGARLTDLAERAQITKQSMGALVDYLEERGYVERVPDAVDKRASIVRRTERGQAVTRAARAGIAELEAEWARRLGAERMEQFMTLLRELVTMLDQL